MGVHGFCDNHGPIPGHSELNMGQRFEIGEDFNIFLVMVKLHSDYYGTPVLPLHCREAGLVTLVCPQQLMDCDGLHRELGCVPTGLLHGPSEDLGATWNKKGAMALDQIASM